MKCWTGVLLFFGLGLFLMGATLQAQQRKYEPLWHALEELRAAKQYLPHEKRHAQVESAQRALKGAIRFVAESREDFAGRRRRLIERLEVLDKQLERDHTRAAKALDAAIEDLDFAIKH